MIAKRWRWGLAGRSPVPEDFGTILSWFTGESATMNRAGSVVFSEVNELGTIAAPWQAGVSLGGVFPGKPVAATVAGRQVMQFGGRVSPPASSHRGRLILSTGTTSQWTIFSNGTSAVTMTLRFRCYKLQSGNTATLMFMMLNTGSERGINIEISDAGVVSLQIRGSTLLTLSSIGTITVGNWHTLQITKSAAGAVSASLDGGAASSGSFTPVATVVTYPPRIGAREATGTTSDMTRPFDGIVAEMVIHGSVLNSAGLAGMRTYMNRWNVAPAYSPMQDQGFLSYWYKLDQVEIISGNVQTFYDESGYEKHVPALSASTRAAFTASWRNGHPAAVSNGTDDSYTGNNGHTTLNVAQPLTVYAVFQHPAQSAGLKVLLFGGSWIGVNGGNWILDFPTEQSVGAVVNNTPIAARFKVDAASSAMRYVTPGGSVVSNTVGASVGTDAWNTGQRIFSGNGANWISSTLAEWIIFEGAAGSETHDDDLHSAYLENKYDILAA